MELVNKTLMTTMFPLEEAKTGENIRPEILKLLVTKFGLHASTLNKIVWVTDEGANVKLAPQPYQRLDCIDHVLNTVLRHGLDITELSKADGAPDIGDTISAAKALVKSVTVGVGCTTINNVAANGRHSIQYGVTHTDFHTVHLAGAP